MKKTDLMTNDQKGLAPSIILLFAITSGLAVANVYFAQPLLDLIAHSLDIPASSIGIVVTMTQIGYALGLLFIVPLGDLLNRKRLIIGQMLLLILALVVTGLASNLWLFLSAMTIVGCMAVVVQVLVAYTAVLANAEQRGQAIGIVTSGVVLGILLARLFSGAVADLVGWRAVYYFSAILIFLMSILLLYVMPKYQDQQTSHSYIKLISSAFHLLLTEKTLQVRGILALLIFASFSVLWSAMVLPLSTEPFLLSHTQIGLFGLAGMFGALAATKAGKWADQGIEQKVTGFSLILLIISWMAIGSLYISLIMLIIGVVILDFAVQAVHVTNQSLIFATNSHAQSRLVGIYMFFYSIGSALGAITATSVYVLWGWKAVSSLGMVFSIIAFIFWWVTKPKQ
ncbi:MFS transporter [Neisseria sp. Ec49-e6-T10]|uniref:MFS transporter n=1 Tax=Neisseria sp. Ec49-e6-T10 TaxID=3140744 RepID=UPI003EB9D305